MALKDENFESKDEAFAEVGYQADALAKLQEAIERRLSSDDIPSRASEDICEEFASDFKDIIEVLRDASGYLKRHHGTEP